LADLGKRPEAEETERQAVEIREKLAAECPTVTEYGVDLGGNYCNLGNLICDSGRPDEALGWVQKAIARLELMAAQEPRLVNARKYLHSSYGGRGRAFAVLGRHAEAVRDYERTLELDDGRARAEILANLAVSRMRKFRKDRDAPGSLAAAADYDALKRTDVMGLYLAASNRAVCAAVIPEDPKTPAADAARLAREQADLARPCLNKAVAAGFKSAEHRKQDKDLDALREREDFKKLLADLAAKNK